MFRRAVYPGSFDPVTNGHLDIIRRACRVFDHVIVAVSDNSSKSHSFSVKERVRMVKECIQDLPQAEADTFSGLLVDYLRSRKSSILIRGMRVVSDMDYEFQMAAMNRQIYPEVETVFLMPDERYTYLSSSIVKDVTRMGASVEDYVPPPVRRALRKKFKIKRR